MDSTIIELAQQELERDLTIQETSYLIKFVKTTIETLLAESLVSDALVYLEIQK